MDNIEIEARLDKIEERVERIENLIIDLSK